MASKLLAMRPTRNKHKNYKTAKCLQTLQCNVSIYYVVPYVPYVHQRVRRYKFLRPLMFTSSYRLHWLSYLTNFAEVRAALPGWRQSRNECSAPMKGVSELIDRRLTNEKLRSEPKGLLSWASGEYAFDQFYILHIIL